MSILKDLNLEIRKALDADKEMYNHLHAKIISDMQKVSFCVDLPVSTANTLISYGEGLEMNFESENFILRLYQIFGK